MMVTVPLLPCVTAVTALPAPSKLSFASTPVVTLPSSATVAVSAAMSATPVTVRLITWVAVLPSLSVSVTVKLSTPL